MHFRILNSRARRARIHRYGNLAFHIMLTLVSGRRNSLRADNVLQWGCADSIEFSMWRVHQGRRWYFGNLCNHHLDREFSSRGPSERKPIDFTITSRGVRSRMCVRQCIGTTNCNAVSRVTRVPEESASCMLFSEPATAASLDKYVVFVCEARETHNCTHSTHFCHVYFFFFHFTHLVSFSHITYIFSPSNNATRMWRNTWLAPRASNTGTPQTRPHSTSVNVQ